MKRSRTATTPSRCRTVGDAGAEHGAAGGAFQRDDPVVHGHREPGRVGEEPVRDHVLGDLAVDLLVGPAEHAQHVGPRDDADQVAVAIDDGEPLELERVHQAGRGSHELVLAYRHGRMGHQVARGGLADRELLRRRCPRMAPIRIGGRHGQQVGLGHDPGHPPVVVDDREAADPVLAEQGGHLAVRGTGLHRHHAGGHDVPHVCVHGFSLPAAAPPGRDVTHLSRCQRSHTLALAGAPGSGSSASRPVVGPQRGRASPGAEPALPTGGGTDDGCHEPPRRRQQLAQSRKGSGTRSSAGRSAAAGHRAAQEPAPVQTARSGRAVLRWLSSAAYGTEEIMRALLPFSPCRLHAGAADVPARPGRRRPAPWSPFPGGATEAVVSVNH